KSHREEVDRGSCPTECSQAVRRHPSCATLGESFPDLVRQSSGLLEPVCCNRGRAPQIMGFLQPLSPTDVYHAEARRMPASRLPSQSEADSYDGELFVRR